MADIDLTTKAAVRELLQGSDQIEDAVLDVMVTAASQAILDETQREFAPKTADTSRDFLSLGTFVDLNPYDLRGKPDAVTLYTDLEEEHHVMLEGGGYLLRPVPPRYGVYGWLELPSQYARHGQVQVTVKGDWGFPAIPAHIAYWCGMTVVIWSRSDISAFSTTYSIDEGRIEKPADLPPAVRAALSRYRRRTVR